MRVMDAVRAIEELSDATVQGLFHLRPSLRNLGAVAKWEFVARMYAEALSVTLAAPIWLNNVMPGSPLRDPEAWKKEGRRRYQAELKSRPRQFEKLGMFE